MKIWTIDDVSSHFSEILESSTHEPQIIADQGEPVAALVDITTFNELLSLQQPPTMAQLLAELREIQMEEPVEFEPPVRQDRANPLLEQV